jgi:uncharacterized membrane-anchored protein YitT (DUF2179 family)
MWRIDEKTKDVIKIFMILIGNIIDSAGFVLFVSNTGLITGGTSGLGLFLSRQTGIPTSLFVLIINALMLVVGYFFLGKRFALSTILSTFWYPIAMGIVERLCGDLVITEDIFLCTVMGGIMIGIGAGMVIRGGASSGGMDVPSLLMNKYLRIPLSTAVYIVDITILALQAFQTPGDNVLYGIVLVLVYSILIDKVSLIGRNRVEVQIISDKSELIRDAILASLDRGVTMIQGRTGYLGKDTQIVMSVISNRQLVGVERIVHHIDPSAFMVVNRVSAVVGEGFTYPAKPAASIAEETKTPDTTN